MSYTKQFRICAKTVGTTPEKLAKDIRRLLSPKKCCDTKRIFDQRVLAMMNCAQ